MAEQIEQLERVKCPKETSGTDYPAEKPWTGAPIPSTGEKPRYAKLPKHHHGWSECDQSGMVVKTFRKNKTQKDEKPPQTSITVTLQDQLDYLERVQKNTEPVPSSQKDFAILDSILKACLDEYL